MITGRAAAAAGRLPSNPTAAPAPARLCCTRLAPTQLGVTGGGLLRRAATAPESCLRPQQAQRGAVTTPRASAAASITASTTTTSINTTAMERRPTFHLAPASGWLNDPNGPLLHNSAYHIFYQHVPRSAEWQWGIVWGHAKSDDLVSWQHLPVALEPTSGGLDRHGCFSGCAALDDDGRPALLYTGVVRKQPHEVEPGVGPQHEAQLIAVPADPDDPDLTRWQTLPGDGSFLPPPPAGMRLTGWRDPFVLQRPSKDSPWWYVMVGAGVRGTCGTALVYRARNLRGCWEYVGPLCESTGSYMWECPVMAKLSNVPPAHSQAPHHQQQPQQQQQQQQLVERHLLAVSPDYCVNPVVGWLGVYADGKFDLAGATGPFPLDLGDILYAPQVLVDKQGRTVLWAWMQERQHARPPGVYGSSCCLCVPRVLSLSPDGGRLAQEPLPELRQLRQQPAAWHAAAAAAAAAGAGDGSNGDGVALQPGQPLQLPLSGAARAAGSDATTTTCSSSSLDLELVVARGGADSLALLLHPFDGQVPAGAAGAAITFSWRTRTLQVVHTTDLTVLKLVAALPPPPRPNYRQPGPDPAQVAAAEAAAAGPGMPSRCGGVLAPGGSSSSDSSNADTLALRMLVDVSCVEVFTGCGAALGTRVYRGDEPPLPEHTRAAAAAATAAAEHAQDAVQAGRGSAPPPSPPPASEAAAPAAATHPGTLPPAAPAGGAMELVSFGPGPATLLHGAAWEMRSMWQQPQEQADEERCAVASPVVLPVVGPLASLEGDAAGADDSAAGPRSPARRRAVRVEAA